MFIIHEIFLHRSGQSVHEQLTFFCVGYSLFTIPWCEFTSKQICPFFSSFILNYILHKIRVLGRECHRLFPYSQF